MSKSLKYTASALVLSVTVVDDQTEEVLQTLTIGVDEVPDLLANGEDEESLKLYAIRKLLQERSSSEKDTEVKFQSMLDTADILRSGKWKSDETKARVAQIDPVFAQALANLKGKPIATIVSNLQSLDKAARDSLRANPKVVAEIERVRAEANAAESETLDLSFE
jgi:hypothetical protein